MKKPNYVKTSLGTQKGFMPVLLILLGLVIIGGGVYFYKNITTNEITDISGLVATTTNEIKSTSTNDKTIKKPSEQIACTMDAMECPDGSYVGRSGPHCEFVCPNDGELSLVKSDIKNNVKIDIFYTGKDDKYVLFINDKKIINPIYLKDIDNVSTEIIGKKYLIFNTGFFDKVYNVNTNEEIELELTDAYVSEDGKYVISYHMGRMLGVGLVIEVIDNKIIKKVISVDDVTHVKINNDILEFTEYEIIQKEVGGAGFEKTNFKKIDLLNIKI